MRVHFFRVVEIGFIIYLHLVIFFRVVLGPIYLGLAQVFAIWFKVCLCVVYYLKFYAVYLDFVYDLFRVGLGLALVLGFVYV